MTPLMWHKPTLIGAYRARMLCNAAARKEQIF